MSEVAERSASTMATRRLRMTALLNVRVSMPKAMQGTKTARTSATPSRGEGRNGIGAHLEGPEVEVAGRPRRAPSRIFAARLDKLDLGLDFLVPERWRTHFEPVADLEPLDQIFAQIEPQPDVIEVV